MGEKMTNAKLIKALEKKGFELNFPSYDSNEDLIINILRERDARIDAAIPLCLKEEFNYKEIHHKLTTNKIDEYLIDNLKNLKSPFLINGAINSGTF